MRSMLPMRAAKLGYIVMSVLFCAMGAVLMMTPEPSVEWVGRLLGIFLILFGSVKLVGYFSRDLFRLAFQYDLAFGLLLIALGCAALCRPNGTLSFLAAMSGIPVLADALFKVQIALDARRFGIRRWWLILALAVLTGIVGAALFFRPAAAVTVMTVLMGAALLADGALNLSVALCTVKIIAHQQPDVIETFDFEIKDRVD